MKLRYNVLQIAIVIQQVFEVLCLSGEWTQWGSWSKCSVTCGYGVQKRQRTWRSRDTVIRDDQVYVYEDIIECMPEKNCPIDGNWGFWGMWSECTVMCGGGTSIRARDCSAPVPQYGGLECDGKSSMSVSCNDWTCPDLPLDFDINKCNETTFMCLSREQCIPLANRCDDTLQCHDGSDEHDCFIYKSHNAAGTNTFVHSTSMIIWTTILSVILRIARS